MEYMDIHRYLDAGLVTCFVCILNVLIPWTSVLMVAIYYWIYVYVVDSVGQVMFVA